VDHDGRNNSPDLYGPLWITVSYAVLLILGANLNDYFISGNDLYVFNTDYCSMTTGIVLLFFFVEGIIYRQFIICLKGSMTSAEVIYLFNYKRVFVWLAILKYYTLSRQYSVSYLRFMFILSL
jgi:hypothetical protein